MVRTLLNSVEKKVNKEQKKGKEKKTFLLDYFTRSDQVSLFG